MPEMHTKQWNLSYEIDASRLYLHRFKRLMYQNTIYDLFKAAICMDSSSWPFEQTQCEKKRLEIDNRIFEVVSGHFALN